MDTVLVTGAAGFIGSNLVRRLQSSRKRVIGIDNLFSGVRENLPPDDATFQFIRADITDKYTMLSLCKIFQPTIIFHLATRSMVNSAGITGARNECDTSIGGLLNLLSCCENTPSIHTFVNFSTASVYGETDLLPTPETACTNPATAYGLFKRAGEGMVQSVCERLGLRYYSIRPSHVYGPYQWPARGHCGVIGKFIWKLSRGEELEVHGDGTHRADFHYIDDFLDRVLALLYRFAPNGTYNSGGTDQRTILDVVDTLREVQGFPVSYQHTAKRDATVYHDYCVGNAKILQATGVTSYTPLKEGIIKTWNWLDDFDYHAHDQS